MRPISLTIILALIHSFIALGSPGKGALSDSTRRDGSNTNTILRRPAIPDSHIRRAVTTQTLRALSMSFEANVGHATPDIGFLVRSEGFTLCLASSEPKLTLSSGVTEQSQLASPTTLSIRPLNTKRFVKPRGLDPLPGRTNYFMGNDPRGWRTNIPNYSTVIYDEIYPGINLLVYGRNGELEYDFVISPGADPRVIRLSVEGADRTSLDSSGNLVLKTGSHEVVHHKPFAYQESGGARMEVAAWYTVGGQGIAIQIGDYNPNKTLVIDPVLSYSTYLGGSGNDSARAIAVDAQGNAYVAGATNSTNFPGSTLPPSNDNIFITKLDPTGTTRLYSTVIGGSNSEGATAIAVDSSGAAYVTGNTNSENFPTVNPFQSRCSLSTIGICSDAFALKLNPDGAGLAYATYLGGSGTEFSHGIAVDSSGNASIVGSTASLDFPVATSLQPHPAGGPAGRPDLDAFVTKLNSAGSGFIYSTYLGGSGSDRATGVAVDSGGNTYVTGFTRSANFPVANAFQTTVRSAFFKTTDEGISWNSRDNGLATQAVISLAIDPGDPSIVYAGTERSGVFKTTDGGSTWRKTGSNSSLDSTEVNFIALDPSNVSVLYAAGGLGVFKSTNGGESWSSTGPLIDNFNVGPLLNVFAVAVGPSSSIVYANTRSIAATGLAKSTNGGENWRPIQSSGGAVGRNALALHPTNSSIIYAGQSKSTDGGITWRRTFTSGDVLVIIIDPNAPSNVYIGAQTGVFKSTDAGDTWIRGTPAGLLLGVRALGLDSRGGTLYAGGEFGGGVLKSTDGGTTWSSVSGDITTERINALAVDPRSPSTVYTGTSIPHDAFATKLNASGSTIVYSTALGGIRDDLGNAIAVDQNGNAFVVGQTTSLDYPALGALQPQFAGAVDVFITKFDPSGSGLFSTYLGGSEIDTAAAVVTDLIGNVHVVGETRSANFPLVNPLQSAFGGGFQGGDAFALRLNPAGTGLAYSTFLGGTETDKGLGIGIDSAGNAYIAGETQSLDFPTAGGTPTTNNGMRDAFVAKIERFSPAGPPLSGIMTVAPTPIETGSNATYTITATNMSFTTVQSLVITDSLPASLRFVSCSSSFGGSCQSTGNSVTASFPALSPGASVILNVTGHLDCSVADGMTILNTVTINSPGLAPVTVGTNVNALNRPPTITCPLDILVQATSQEGAAINFSTPTAFDACPGADVICSPPSGSTLSVGTTTISCVATDSGGARTTCTFKAVVTTENIPRITDASVVKKNLIVTGEGFDKGAVILLGANQQKTKSDRISPSTTLIGKKVGKEIARGQTVILQVRNPSGLVSAPFVFTRPE